MFPTFKRLHLLDHLILFLCVVSVGFVNGILMNAINFFLSPDYFDFVIRSNDFWDIIKQGALEGLFFGCIFSTVFTSLVFIVSKSSCPLSVSTSYFPRIVSVIWGGWFVGGFNGIVINLLFPEFFFGPAPLRLDHLRFFWVGGSIYGAYFGSFLALLLGCVWFKRDWKRFVDEAQTPN